MVQNIQHYIIILFLLLGVSLNSSNITIADSIQPSQVLHVGGVGDKNFSSIQDAIKQASPSALILVYPGLYNESIDIYKTLYLKSVIAHQAKILFQGKDDTVEINADGCTLEGFNISHFTGGGYTSLTVSGNDNTIKNNIFYQNPGHGLYFVNCLYNTVENNQFFSDGITIIGNSDQWTTHTISNNTINEKQILFIKNTKDKTINSSSYGQIILANCSQCIITNCSIEYGDQGILLGHCNHCTIQYNTIAQTIYGLHLSYSEHCNVVSNSVCNNQYGIYIIHSNNNILSTNTIKKQNLYGVWICCNSKENTLYHNNFIDNNHSAYDLFSNQWHTDHQGNYWSDYTGADNNNDGIGDTSYSILGETAVDPYPLMNPFTQNNSNKPTYQTSSYPFVFILIVLILLTLLRKNRSDH